MNNDNPQQVNNNEVDKNALKGKKSFRFFKFLLVSCVTGVVGLGSFALLMLIFDELILNVSHTVAIVIAEYFSVLWSCICSFLLNRKFTFRDRKARRMGIVLYILYYAVTTPLSSWLIIALNSVGIHVIICKLIKMTINVALDFLYCRYFIFKYIKKVYDIEPEKGEGEPNI